MIDYIHIEIDILKIPFDAESNSTKPFKWLGLIFSPKFNRDGHIISYQSKYSNLLILLKGHKLILKNSIHIFYCGSNHDDFTLYDFHRAIQFLSNKLCIDITEALIKKMEYGCNIPWTGAPIYKGLTGYRRGAFYPMLNGVKQYGKIQISTDYSIKMYDKQYEVNTHHKLQIQPTLRFEKLVKKRYLKNVGIIKIKDLLKKKVWEALAKDLYDIYISIPKDLTVNFKDLKRLELTVIAIFAHAEVAKYLRQNYSYTYRRYKRISLNLPNDSDLIFRKRLKKKCKQLIKVNSDLLYS